MTTRANQRLRRAIALSIVAGNVVALAVACDNELNLDLTTSPATGYGGSDGSPGYDSSLPSTGTVLGDAGPATLFTSGQPNVTSIALDDDNVYWVTNDPDGGVFSCPKAGCTEEPPLLVRRARPSSIGTFDKRLYWTENGSPNLYRCDAKSCETSITAIDAKHAFGGQIALDDAGVYIVDGADAGTLTKCMYDATCTVVDNPDGGAPTRVATGGGEVFFTVFETGHVRHFSPSTPIAEDLPITDPTRGVRDLAVSPSGGFVYFVNEETSRIHRVTRTSSSTKTEVFSNQKARLIVADESNIVWSDADGYVSSCASVGIGCTPSLLLGSFRVGALVRDPSSNALWFSSLFDDTLRVYSR